MIVRLTARFGCEARSAASAAASRCCTLSRLCRFTDDDRRFRGGEVATIFAAWLLSMNLTSKWPGKQ